MHQYLLLLHEEPTDASALAPEEMQSIIAEYSAWSAKLAGAERLEAGHKLTDEGGRWLTRASDGLTVKDGPYSEAKEVIGGLFVIRAENYDDAVRLCDDHPHLKFGGRIEIRQIDDVGSDS